MSMFSKISATSGLLAGAIAATLFFAQPQAALAACSDPNTNCLEKLHDAQQNVNEHQGNAVSDAWERAKAAGEAVKQCVNCAMDNIKSNMDQVTTTPDPDSSGNPQ